MYDGFLGGLVRRYGWRKFQIVFWTLTAVGVFLLTLLFVFRSFASTPWGVLIAFVGIVLLCIGIPFNIIIPNRRRRYEVFDTAFSHPADEVPLVEVQPVPDIAALELPASIDLTTRRSLARFTTITVWLIGVVGFLTTHNVFVLLALVPITLGIIVSIIQDHDVALAGNDQKISLSEDVIAVSPTRTERQAIVWDDVRVFALIQQLPSGTKVYMLSSGDKEVRWTHRPRTHWYSLAAPTTSDAIYNQQMEALLSYAAARTGLPLIDMR